MDSTGDEASTIEDNTVTSAMALTGVARRLVLSRSVKETSAVPGSENANGNTWRKERVGVLLCGLDDVFSTIARYD